VHFAGTVIHGIDKVDPTMAAMVEESPGLLHLRGIDGMISLLKKTKWKPDKAMDKNPVYAVFTLKKN
jgi:hypothetical protein